MGLWGGAACAATSVAVNVTVINQVNPAAGINGHLQVAMSTTFQLAPWSYQYFSLLPAAVAPLQKLSPAHTTVQAIDGGIPLTAPGVWDFSKLNTMVPPIQNTGDHSPRFQIATAPAYMSDASGHILPERFSDFAQMSANLVRYYNSGGFTDGGPLLRSPTQYPITWWGIFNEPNGNGLSPQQYVDLYNAVAPAMLQADPSIQLMALELSDFGTAAESYMPAFVSGVTAPVGVLATHFYSSCSQKDTDAQVFATIPGFVKEVNYIYSQLRSNAAMAGVPVWVTENNVNADFDTGNGMSSCDATQAFTLDPRGTDPFFAAYRSLVYILLGEAGVQALYHWSFAGNQQFGEVDSTASPYLSYWVDYYLSHWLPASPGQDILQTTQTGCCLWIFDSGNPLGLDTHTLAARNPDGSVLLLLSNHAIHADEDNNGPGTIRDFKLDVSALGSFNRANLVQLDATTPLGGPVIQELTPAPQMEVILQGYGAAMLRLFNDSPVLTIAGVANAANFASGSVAPGEIVSLFGTALGPAAAANLELTNSRLVANSLAGVRVWFDGIPAPVLYASAGQINAVVPNAVAGQSNTVIQVEYLGGMSPPVTVPVTSESPAVFTMNAAGQGQGAILNAVDLSVNSASNPVHPGDWVSIFGTGAGATLPASVDGLLPSGPSYAPVARVSVTIGGLSCEVNYAAAAPGLVSGVLQVNARVPTNVTPGDNVPVQVTAGTAVSQNGVTVAVR